jgi:hypothetical protein
MKKSIFGIVIIVIMISCENVYNTSDDFLFKTGNGLEYKYSDLQLYDSSTHIFYLKASHPEFREDKSAGFSLLANGEEIYKGVFWPMFSSSLPFGPYIPSFSSFYPDFTIRIEHLTIDNKPDDPRNDPRLISALKNQNLLHSGICGIINSITVSGTHLTFKFTVTNKDESDLIILDPEKTGPNLFHYFTNGLSLRKPTFEEVFASQIAPQTPSPWDSWSDSWLSEIKSGDSRQFTINYSINSPINPGDYIASFEFPGLSHGVSREQFIQGNKRIWLGDIVLTKKITLK